jgi:CRISPR-associated protein Cas2
VSEQLRRLLVAYDVANDRRRDRLAVLLQEHGERVQFSVFVVEGRPAAFVRLRGAAEALIDLAEDTVLFVDLGPRTRARDKQMTWVGRRPPLTGDADTLIV